MRAFFSIHKKNGPISYARGDDFISPLVIRSQLPLTEEPEKSALGPQQMNQCHCISICVVQGMG